MAKPLQQHAQALADAVTEALHADPSVEEDAFIATMREMLLAQRSSLNKLFRDGTITEDTFSQLVSEVDTALAEPQSEQVKLILNRPKNPIRGLMSVIVQESDVESVITVLNRLGILVTRLSSSGGFLGRKNTTLLAGIPSGKDAAMIKAIKNVTRSRVEFLPNSIDPSEQQSSVTVGKATIFTFEVERYEEI
jgi:uncharacterized protein YaaQ